MTMKMRVTICLLGLLWVLVVGCERQDQALSLGGGPGGSSFHGFSIAMAELFALQLPEFPVKVHRSGGSVVNLVRVEQGKLSMGLVYAGDAYLGRLGKLSRYPEPTQKVRALARLYGASAQLLVLKSSPIKSPFDLRKTRVAVGSPGSGSAISARRFFKSLGLWEEITPIYAGFAMGLDDLGSGRVEAVWMLVGVPNARLMETARNLPLRLLDLFDAAVVSGFFENYPFYGVATVSAGTYPGQVRDVRTFQDSVLWITSTQMDESQAYRALELLFSQQGVAYMRSRQTVAEDLDSEKGLMGVNIPLHQGAERFWKARAGLPGAGGQREF